MRATFAVGRDACMRCDACDGRGSSTSHIVVWDIANADGVVDKRLLGAMYQGIRDYHANTLTFDACPTCLTKIARVCDVCGAAKELDRDHCHECARAFAVADRQGKATQETIDAALMRVLAVTSACATVGNYVVVGGVLFQKLKNGHLVPAMTCTDDVAPKETAMPKTLQQITDTLAAQDKHLGEALDRVARHLRTGHGMHASGAWATLPAAFRAKYSGITANGDLIPAKTAVFPSDGGVVAAYDSKAPNAAEQLTNAQAMMESLGIITPTMNTTAAPTVEAPKETAMTTPPKTAPDLRNELNTAAWRAGIEIATEEGRDLLVALLTDGMTDDEAAAARPLFAKAFAGRFGVPIVSGAIGGVLHAVQSAGVEIPFVTPATAARIGEEMRVLSAAGMMKVVYRSGRDLLAKHGGKMMEAITNLGRIAERTGVRVESDLPAMEDATWPTDAAKIARGNGAAS